MYIFSMVISVTFSKPAENCEQVLGKNFVKVRIVRNAGLLNSESKKARPPYSAEFFTKTQAFQKSMSEEDVNAFIDDHAGKTFKNVVQKTDSQEICYFCNRRGEVKKSVRNISGGMKNIQFSAEASCNIPGNRKKNYILKEGSPIPFLVHLGVMTKDGNVVASKYAKFRQINRFLEYVRDIIPEVKKLYGKDFSRERPLRIADFGCGKSYLTFAVYYYLWQIENIPVQITGLDLKEDVIAYCQKLSDELNYDSLKFFVGNIADFSYENKPDIIITLHACDTATDFALNFAVKQNALAILSVPCCQHEINLQLEKNKSLVESSNPFASLEHWGIFRERFAALATDAIRAELLEESGYSVQVLEFIDMEHTPKNILLRAVRKRNADAAKDGCLQSGGLEGNADERQMNASVQKSRERLGALLKTLGASQSLCGLLES
ncbi:MAG: SAM-dependent methyltransferase [Treponema sp.]|nr:SAM-dependent methyltransferase [Treponema sp.]